jgi:signal transduction histidine kinase
VQSTAYFIVAEALTNALKHAGANAVHVRMEQLDGQLVVTVTDDGVGGAAPTAGSGLSGLMDRAEALGGRLTVDGPADAGTTLTAVLPYSPALVGHG